MLTQTDMYRGAQAQSRLSLVDKIDGRRVTRHEALTGFMPDVSTFAGPPGCLAWAYEPDAKASSGRVRAVSCMYICPHPTMAAHIVRIWGSRKLRITRHVTVAPNFNTRALLACLAHESLPRSPLANPPAAAYASCVTRLLLAYPNISDVHHAAVIHNPISGMPDSIATFAPSLLDDGSIAMTNTSTPPIAAAAPTPIQPAPNAHPSALHRLSKRPNKTLDPTDLAWFLALPSSTKVHVVPNRKDHSNTKLRKSAYAQASTIADLFLPAGSRVWCHQGRSSPTITHEPSPSRRLSVHTTRHTGRTPLPHQR